MNNKRIAELIRLAEIHVNEMDPKLYGTKSKIGVRNYIYKITDPFVKGKFSDENWSGVKSVFDVIAKRGLDINWWVENGGYASDRMSKSYQFEINFENMYGTKFKFRGQLMCCFCGSVQDPMSRYDMIFQIY